MTVYIPLRVTPQEQYTEPRHYQSAREHVELCGVFTNRESAQRRIDELKPPFPPWPNDPDYCEYLIQEMKVEV